MLNYLPEQIIYYFCRPIGRVAQLNRASRPGFGKVLGLKCEVYKVSIGRVAQLNRASDYGSEGFRFES